MTGGSIRLYANDITKEDSIWQEQKICTSVRQWIADLCTTRTGETKDERFLQEQHLQICLMIGVVRAAVRAKNCFVPLQVRGVLWRSRAEWQAVSVELIDTHNHLDLPLFIEDFSEVLQDARDAGIVSQVLPGVCRSGWERIVSLAAEHADLHAAIGLHPMYLQHHSEGDLALLRNHTCAGQLVAIGEIGLDYYVKDTDRTAQQELFEAQVAIAAEYRLPVLLHVRKAHDQVQAILRRKNFRCGGIVHAFSGSLQQAEKYLQLGFMISVCGTVTYDRATRIRRVIEELPLGSLVLETDAPDIPPAAHNGERNSPAYLPQILSAVAELRQESEEEIAAQTTANCRRLLFTGSL